ncbi:MAG: L,D-transpeptidase YbiS [Verrucomicrobiales bacterium]|jgi:L,D-transpeptidase YbiS
MGTLRVEVSVEEQQMRLYEDDAEIRSYPISTAKNGTGCEEGSNCTPLGEFEIYQKIGDDAPLGTIFKGREAIGEWGLGDESEEDLILTRILWLGGLNDENANTRERYIYIHGTNQEELIGQPVSHGCVRMRNDDVIDLYALVGEGTSLRIA